MADMQSDRVAQLRDKAYRIASMVPSDEGYDEVRSAKARTLLDALAKHRAPEIHEPQRTPAEATRSTDEGPATELATAKDPTGPNDVLPLVEQYVTRPIAQAGNAYLGGALNPINDFLGTDSPSARAEQDSKHPVLMGTANVVGGIAPSGIPARLAAPISGGIEAASKLSPRVAALLGRAAAVPGGAVVGRAAAGAAAGGALGGILGGVRGSEDGPDAAINEALAGAKSGAGFGAAFGGGSRMAETGAGAMRTPEIALLEHYGMEPGLPGRPVVRENASVAAGYREPSPTGNRTAGPRTRAEAGIRAAEPIVNDLAARETVNRREIGRVRAENEQTFAQPSIPSQEMVLPLILARGNAGLSPSAAGHLNTLETRIRQNSSPPALEDMPLKPTAKLSPPQAQEIRMLADDYAGQNKAGKLTAAKVQMQNISRDMKALQPPEIRAQDESYANAQSGIEQSRLALGLREKGRIPSQRRDPRMTIKASTTIRQSPENTATASKAARQLQALREDGPPPVMKDSPPEFLSTVGPGPLRYKSQAVAPEAIDYSSLLDLPALQSAQESLQMSPSATFSGGWKGAVSRVLGAGGRRLIYPELKRLGNAEVAPHAVVGGDIVSLIKRKWAEIARDRSEAESRARYPIQPPQQTE